ncbi:MAG: hypothetical protein HZB21_00470 [Deltaproteobacteria bacterium]|nr:hypothetical protein [Deltaproteobacteria bacterium]
MLKEAGLDLAGVVDASGGKKFFGCDIRRIEDIKKIDYEIIIITSFQAGSLFKESLLKAGVNERDILDISSHGWLERQS